MDADLARRAVACREWRRMPGMLATVGSRVVAVDGPVLLCWALDALPFGAIKLAGTAALPDFNDAATLGALLGLVLSITSPGPDSAFARAVNDATHLLSAGRWDIHVVEALIAALEAAPVKP